MIPALLCQAEGYFWVGDSEVGEDLGDGRALRPSAPQEGSPCRDVIEETVHDDGGAFRVRGGGELGLGAALDDDACTALFAGRGGQAEG
jgi:hypothetical protein